MWYIFKGQDAFEKNLTRKGAEMNRNCFMSLMALVAGLSFSGSLFAQECCSAGPKMIKLTGPTAGMVLWKQDHTSYVESPDGLELHAEQPNKKEPLYLSLDVKDPDFIDGNAPVQEFSFEYFDTGNEEVTFDIDTLVSQY